MNVFVREVQGSRSTSGMNDAPFPFLDGAALEKGVQSGDVSR